MTTDEQYVTFGVYPPDAAVEPFEQTFELEPTAPWLEFMHKHLEEGCYVEAWRE